MKWFFWLLLTGIVTGIVACGGGGSSGSSSLTDSSATTQHTDTTDDSGTSSADDISLEDISNQLQGLEPAGFFETSFQILLSRNPETVVASGLGQEPEYALDGTELNNVSSIYRQRTAEIVQLIADELQTWDPDSLNAEDRLSYDIYNYYLADELRAETFAEFEFPGTWFSTSIQFQTLFFFTDIHPLDSERDMQNFVARLDAVDEKFDQLIEVLRAKETSGILAPAFAYQQAVNDLRSVIQAGVEASPYYVVLEEKSALITDITSSRRNELLNNALQIIEQSILPAYQRLETQVERLIDRAPDDGGVAQYPGGSEFYQFALRHHTTTDMTATQLHELGLNHLERIHGEMRSVFANLGFPLDESIPGLFQRLTAADEIIPSTQVVSYHQTVIQQAYSLLESAFLLIPQTGIEVIGVNHGGFYVAGTTDGSRAGAFYASSGSNQPRYQLPSLTYHETVPGHHLQISMALETDLPLFRRHSHFTAYIEGWALYAERLAYELGWYEDDPAGNLGRLQYEAYRAARLVVDTGLHDLGWGFDEASRFFADNTGFSLSNARNQIARYLVWPGQATAYMTGMIRILELRDKAQLALGDRFDLREFHDVVLGNGPVPLAILETIVDQYIDTTLSATEAP